MDIEKFKIGILKTGFVLENDIAQFLNKKGWTVISNKYYEDDFEEKVREIDLLAYKVGKVQNFDVYTCLIISCKKNESNTWALLCKDINLKDPNSDWWPLHSWSNQKSIQYQLSISGKAKEYYDDLKKLGVKEAVANPSVEIFAFQEMNSESGSPQNDKAIYDSIISLIKAQAYEIGALPDRKKVSSVYQFNLLSVVDANIVRLKFNGDEISTETVTSEHYVSRYILKKRQSFSRIRFISASIFKNTLEDYANLHKANLNWFDKVCNDFYSDIEIDQKRIEVYIDDFRKSVRWMLEYRTYKLLNRNIKFEYINLWWRKKKSSLVVDISADQDVLNALNNDADVKQAIGETLQKLYRYTGAFHFDDDIPF